MEQEAMVSVNLRVELFFFFFKHPNSFLNIKRFHEANQSYLIIGPARVSMNSQRNHEDPRII